MIGWMVLLVSALFVLKSRFSDSKLPPGPPRGLFGDNRAQMSAKPYETWTQLAKKYGHIFSFVIGNKVVIVLNTAQAAWDLLEKRGEIYSSRPRSIMGHEILSRKMWGLGMAYNDKWRKWRKLQHSCLNTKYAVNYQTFQMLESSILLRDLLDDPAKYSTHFTRQEFATSMAFTISYGGRIGSLDDQVVKDNAEAGRAFGSAQIPGKYIVESWPSLLWLPKRLQWFRWEFEKRRLIDLQLYLSCFRNVKRRMDSGIVKPCLSTKMWEEGPSEETTEIEMAYYVASPFSAGISTISSALDVFLLAMLHFPDCARRAQAELDSVSGRSRMPTFDDQSSLPYLRALIKETTRWRVVAPMGMPHATTEDDVYEGYHIPKGATVFGNIYMISKDPELFPDPEAFKPERFLDTTDPRLVNFDLPFGFGRRICPAQHVAEQTLFITIARILWSFDISPVLDKGGKPLLPDPEDFRSNLTARPAPFDLQLTVRDSETGKVIVTEASQSADALREWEG